jgi:uncharacterized protein
MSRERSAEELKALLDSTHRWPTLFAFKFIVPNQELERLLALLPSKDGIEVRPSAQGKYQGVTAKLPMGSAQEVLDIYSKVQGIPGLISL